MGVDVLGRNGGYFGPNWAWWNPLVAYCKEIELYFGQLQYNGSDHDAVLVKPLSPPDNVSLDDEIIPF